MTLEGYYEKLNKVLPRLLDIDTFIEILNLKNNLYRFDILNRIALNIMNENKPIDVKTEEEWFELGRKVINKKDCYYTLYSNYNTIYIDKETQDEINMIEFTLDEIQRGIELGVIEKRTDIADILITRVYDFRNTSNIDKKKKYNVIKTETNLEILIDLAKSILGLTIEECDEVTFYSEKDKHLFLKKDTYSNMVETVIDIFIKSLCKEYYIHNNESKYREIVEKCSKYSIQTLFNIKSSNEIRHTLKKMMITDVEEYINILKEVDDITHVVLKHLENINNIDNCGSIQKIEKNAKIDSLLNIMQANSIQLKMKGA